MSELDVQPAAAAPEASAAEPVAPEPQDNAPAPEIPEAKGEPDWFMKDKYKTVEDQAKAQYEMQNLIGRMGRNWGPPKDEYKLDAVEGMDPNDPILQHLKPAFKEIGLSQEGVNGLIKSYKNAQAENAKEFEAEIKKDLTPEDAMAIKEVNSRLDEDFPPDIAANMKAWCMTKKDFHDLRNVLALIPRKTNVPSAYANATPLETVDQVNQDKIKYLNEVKQGLRVQDNNHWDKLNERFRDAYTRETHNKR